MHRKNGILFVGLCGDLSATVMAGAMAVAKKICPPLGMVSEMEPFHTLPFAGLSELVFGGWDVRSSKDAQKTLRDLKMGDVDAFSDILGSLETVYSRIFPGIILNAGSAISDISEPTCVSSAQTLSSAVDKVSGDIQKFRQENQLETVVVINLASTEPPVQDPDLLSDIGTIQQTIMENRIDCIRPSLIYAWAAITSGCPYINFTPSEAGLCQGLVALAEKHGVPVMGSDGKTGETLVKSALAPMFAMRNLEVLSWEGFNILGNMDGKILNSPENRSAKIRSKDRLLPHILGYQPHTGVSIDYVPSLGDRKTAWDFIHFQGFLNTQMSLQFTWQGCDSALAAPLVLDLARFAILALERGESGTMKHLASFFKSPFGVNTHSLEKQFLLLEEYCHRITTQTP